jgi:hypothetical protein
VNIGSTYAYFFIFRPADLVVRYPLLWWAEGFFSKTRAGSLLEEEIRCARQRAVALVEQIKANRLASKAHKTTRQP